MFEKMTVCGQLFVGLGLVNLLLVATAGFGVWGFTAGPIYTQTGI